MDFSFTFRKKPEGGGKQPAKTPASQEQFDRLRGCGINLRGHATIAQVVAGMDDALFEQTPFAHLLCLMGGTQENGDPWSDEVWLWPAGTITESGVLSACVAQVCRLCRGALPLEDVADAFDPESDQATLTFALDGEALELVHAVEHGDVDAGLLSALAGVAADRGDGARLASCGVDGVGNLLVFMTDAEIAELAETSGLEWTPVE